MENNDNPIETNDQSVITESPSSYQSPAINATNEIKLKKEVKGYKKLLIVAILIGIVSVGGLVYYNFTKKVAASYNAEVSLVSGQVEKSEKTGVWIELKNTDSVKQGDVVRVNGVGKAIITLDDGSAIRLSDNSRILLTSLDPKDIQINNESGEVYTRVVKADRPFVVKVDDESYKAMGTAYKTVNLEKEKGVFVYESKVQVVAANVEVVAGKKFFKNNTTDAGLVGVVSDILAADVLKDDFVQWNKEQDLKNEEFKNNLGVLEAIKEEAEVPAAKEVETPVAESKNDTKPVVVSAKIILKASTYASGVELSWTTVGIDATKGFKIVRSISENPIYPGNEYVYLSSSSARSHKWEIKDGITYNFRVCQYTGSGCSVYSNNVKVIAPSVAEEDGVVTGLVLSGSGSDISWTVAGYSDKGFKVVYSKSSSPTYPTRSSDRYHYYSESSKRTDTLEGFDGAGTYYVRVCEYLGGACGVYSNEITVSL